MSLSDPSTRIALAAFLHDIGKLAERAGIDHGGRLDAHKILYCPWHADGGYHSHVHAAESVARTLDQEAGRSNKNKPTQIRRFYDELVGWQERIGGDDAKFKQYGAFIRMLNAKVAYAKGRGLVGDEFERWFRECIKSTASAKALDHFRLHCKTVLGFLKTLRG